MPEHAAGDQHGLGQRLMKVEEACAFSQHELEQVSTEVAELGRRVGDTLRRLEALERRLAAQEEGNLDATPARPPHAAGPPPT
jgi:uncharacterized coiled-coil protein SlyX